MNCENCRYYDVDYEWNEDCGEEIEIGICKKGHEIDFELRNICPDFKKYKSKQYIEKDTKIVFWVLWIALTVGSVIGFCYFDNRWLED